MNVIIAATGFWPGMVHTVKAYRARAGCPVHVLSENREVQPDAKFDDFDGGEAASILRKVFPPYSLRWLFIDKYVKQNGITGPLFCPDWDMMGFTDMTKACAPFCEFDIGSCKTAADGWNAISFFRDERVLSDYARFITDLVISEACMENKTPYNDMALSNVFWAEHDLRRANMAEIVNGGTFDHNIHCGLDVFRAAPDGKTKEVMFKDGVPHFFENATGNPIVAHVIHCWGSYKSKTGALLSSAGIV